MSTLVTVPRARARGTGRRVLGLLLRRLLGAALVLLVVTIVIFGFVHAAPGSPEQAIGGREASPDQLAAIRATYHLDDPLPLQYINYLRSLVSLDLGQSYSLREPVMTVVTRAALNVTIPLLLISWVLATVIGAVLGYQSARSRGGALDRTIVAFTVLGASSPAFVTGMLLTYVFGIQLHWLPVLGGGDGGLDTIVHLILPALTITIVLLASTTKLTRVRMAQILDEDQLTFARARGLSPIYLIGHVFIKNSAVHLITFSGSLLVTLIGGLVLVEQLFGLSGIGSLLITAINNRDIPLVQGVTLLIAIAVVLVNLVVDALCYAVDPRIRQGMSVSS
jgi:ABC-type dipeptide/oligopeptide/nickel transport system permease component